MSSQVSPHARAKLRPLGVYGPLSKIAHAWMRARGWSIEILDPLPEKCVIAVYPHTSNWDFPIGLLSKWAAGLTANRDALRYAGKESLFKWPWGWFFRAVGGFPLDRSGNTGFAEQMAARFQSEPRMRFVIAPEGTRKYVDHMRSSFYYVAKKANVPIILTTFAFEAKRVILTETFIPSDDVDADLARIDAYYRSLGRLGHTPENAAPWRFRKR
ncbi:MAG: 1-acyl-sn-glycerol-3-phosphate acyltransferase [Casimicrobium sp.]